MQQFQIQTAKPLRGTLLVPGDKSISHRAVLLAALAQGVSVIDGFLLGSDNVAMLVALQKLGVPITVDASINRVTVQGRGLWGLCAPSSPLDLQNSGTAMRLLMGLLAGQRFNSALMGDASLSKRPMRRVADPLSCMGASLALSEAGTAPVFITGHRTLKAIRYELPVASAQVKSALLLAGLYAEGETKVIEPLLTRDHTERLLQAFSYPVGVNGSCMALSGGHALQATAIEVPGDLSSAAFFMVAATLISGSEVLLQKVGVNPTRLGVITLLRAMGADIQWVNQRFLGQEPVSDMVVRSAPLRGIDISPESVALAIDELPVLMVAAACASGVTTIRGAKELRVKETDRIAAMAKGLTKMGIACRVTQDGIIIRGGVLRGARVQSDGDHRIAMAFAVAGCLAGNVIVDDCQNVSTSLPDFVELAQRIGMNVHAR